MGFLTSPKTKTSWRNIPCTWKQKNSCNDENKNLCGSFSSERPNRSSLRKKSICVKLVHHYFQSRWGQSQLKILTGRHQPNLPLISNAPHCYMACSFRLQAVGSVTLNAPPETRTPPSLPSTRPALATLSAAVNAQGKKGRQRRLSFLLTFRFNSFPQIPITQSSLAKEIKVCFISPPIFPT